MGIFSSEGMAFTTEEEYLVSFACRRKSPLASLGRAREELAARLRRLAWIGYSFLKKDAVEEADEEEEAEEVDEADEADEADAVEDERGGAPPSLIESPSKILFPL